MARARAHTAESACYNAGCGDKPQDVAGSCVSRYDVVQVAHDSSTHCAVTRQFTPVPSPAVYKCTDPALVGAPHSQRNDTIITRHNKATAAI